MLQIHFDFNQSATNNINVKDDEVEALPASSENERKQEKKMERMSKRCIV
jgi:hypothetical protein